MAEIATSKHVPQRSRRLAIGLAVAALLGAGSMSPGFAQAPAQSATAAVPAQHIDWAGLTPVQQQALAPLHEQWTQLPPRQQQRLLRIAARWQDATAQQRAAITERLSRWAALTPEQRTALIARYEKFRELPPEQQQDLRDAFKRFRDLPPEQRQALRQRFEQMTPGERDAFIAGAGAEKRSRGWQQLLANLPPEQRAATRAMWLGFSVSERHALRRWLRPLSAEDRDVLRVRLLAMSPAQRSDFIAALPSAPAKSP